MSETTSGNLANEDLQRLENDREIIRGMWQMPAFCHFCQVFRSVLGLPSFSPRDLESALFESYHANSSNMLLPELFWKLTQCGTDQAKSKKIKLEGFPDWSQAAFKLLKFVYDFDYSIPFHLINVKDKLLMLYSLCDRTFDAYPSMVQNSGKTADEMRLRPIGRDSKKRCYYRFSDDAWIFSEKQKDYVSHRLQSCAPVWEVVSTTTDELRALCHRLDNSDYIQQCELVNYLLNDLLPSLEADERNRARLEYRKQLFSLMPKRQSSRIQSKQEEEERRRQEEQEQLEHQLHEAEKRSQREQIRKERRNSLLAEQDLSPRDARAIRALRRPLRSNTVLDDSPKISKEHEPCSDDEVSHPPISAEDDTE